MVCPFADQTRGALPQLVVFFAEVSISIQRLGPGIKLGSMLFGGLHVGMPGSLGRHVIWMRGMVFG